MRQIVASFIEDRTAATAIEYGLLVAVLSLAIVAGVSYAAQAIQFLFGTTESALIQSFNK